MDDLSMFIGRDVKGENGETTGRIVSFLIDSSGDVRETLIETKNGDFAEYPIERLKVNGEEVFLVTDVEKRAEALLEKFPIIQKKIEVLDRLSQNNDILPEIYERLGAEFSKTLDEMRREAQSVLEDVEKGTQTAEDSIRTLQLARTFLEMEHAIGTVKDEAYQESLMSILKAIKNASYKKTSLLKAKDRVFDVILNGEGKPADNAESQSGVPTNGEEAKPTIVVHMTQE